MVNKDFFCASKSRFFDLVNSLTTGCTFKTMMSKKKNSNTAPKIKVPTNINRLYRLIETLTQAQKRDFKKYTQFWDYQKNRRYLELFDLANQSIRAGKDEHALMEHLKRQRHLGNNAQISNTAGYLYTKILDSVRLNQEVSPLTNRLLTMLQDINFLFYKGLYDDCERLIRDAKKLALALDKSTYFLELSVWERRLYFSGRSFKEQVSRVREIVAEEKEAVQGLEKYFELNTLSNSLNLNYRSGKILVEDAVDELKVWLQQDEAELLKGLSLRAKFWYYNSQYYYYESQHKLQQPGKKGRDNLANLRLALTCLDKILSMSENEGKTLASEEPSLFNSFIDNYINLCLRLGEFDRIERLEHETMAAKDKTQYYRSSVYHRLTELLRKSRFGEAEELIRQNDLARQLPLFEYRIEEARLHALRYYCGLIYFCLEKFKEASNWYEAIFDGSRIKSNPTLFLTVEFQHVITLFEQGVFNKNPLRPLNNLHGKLRRNKQQNDFLELLLTAMRLVFEPTVQSIRQGAEGQDIFEIGKDRIRWEPDRESLKTHIASLQSFMNANKTHETYFSPVVAWLESKANGTTVAEEIIKYQS